MSTPCVQCNKPKMWRNADGKCTDCAPIVWPVPIQKEEKQEKPGPKKL